MNSASMHPEFQHFIDEHHLEDQGQCGSRSWLLSHLQSRWIVELEQLLACVERSCRCPVGQFPARELDAKKRWSPVVFLRISNLRSALLTKELSKILDAVAAVKRLPSHELYDDAFRIESILCETWENDFIGHMRNYAPLGKNGEGTVVLPLLSLDIEPIRREIENALQKIEMADPSLRQDFSAFVTRIKLFQGRVLRGETNTAVFGAIFFRLAPPSYHQEAYWVEHVVHEVAHLRLELLRAHDPLILNDAKEVFPAPFRRDLRPMIGVFHATYVLSRMIRVVRRLSQMGTDPIYDARLPFLHEKLLKGVEAISRSAHLTGTGEMILRAIRAEISAAS
jgi:hypothetical protein